LWNTDLQFGNNIVGSAIATWFAMDECKIERETLSGNELKSPINEDTKHERISVIIPAMKCEAEVNHVAVG
jgi:hypothetical protein